MESKKHRIFLAHNSYLNSAYDLNVLRAGLAGDGYEVVAQPEEADEVLLRLSAFLMVVRPASARAAVHLPTLNGYRPSSTSIGG